MGNLAELERQASMNGPETLAHLLAVGIVTTAEEMIEKAVDRLIAALYIPVVTSDSRLVFMRDSVRCDRFGVEEEAINWGDLKCCDVRAFADGTYQVTIDEASPGGCSTFCEYIRHHLAVEGWKCEIQTEW